jgi:hypothetical protein
MDEEVHEPLVYKPVLFEKKEWDNIPMVIPRFCLHLQKQLDALTGHYKQRCDIESPIEERENLLKRLQEAMLNSDTANGKLFSEINDLHDKLIKL